MVAVQAPVGDWTVPHLWDHGSVVDGRWDAVISGELVESHAVGGQSSIIRCDVKKEGVRCE